MRLKALLIVGSYPPAKDSIADGIWHFAEHLERRGIETVVATRYTEETAEFAARDHRRKVILLGTEWNLKTVCLLRGAVRRENPDVIHLWYEAYNYDRRFAICLVPLSLKMRHSRTPLMITIHELWGPVPWWRIGNSLLFTFSDLLSIRQAAFRTHLKRWYPWVLHKVQDEFSPSNIPVINEPTEITRMCLRARYKLPSEQIIACYFGLLHGHKGIEEIFEAVRMIRREGEPLSLLMLCEVDLVNDAFHRRMYNLARQKGISEAVIWTGRCEPEVVSLYLSMSDFCLLNYQDGATERRGSLMAALAHGLPVITTQSSQTPQLFQDCKSMLLVPFGDVQALVGAVRRLSSDPAIRSTLARSARQLYESFSWDHLARITIESYERLVRASHRGESVGSGALTR